jgi:hypothetical protein
LTIIGLAVEGFVAWLLGLRFLSEIIVPRKHIDIVQLLGYNNCKGLGMPNKLSTDNKIAYYNFVKPAVPPQTAVQVAIMQEMGNA